MDPLFVIIPIVVLVSAIAGMVRFRLYAWLAVTSFGLAVGVLDAFRMFFLLSVGEGASLFPAAALVVYYGTFGFLVGAIAEFIRYLHRLTHGRKPKKDIV